jgi:serine/threonine protein kinase
LTANNQDRAERIQDILQLAVEADPVEVAALLDHECGSDASLRAEVESLLASLGRAGRFLSGPADNVMTPEPGIAHGSPHRASIYERPGAKIGLYTLVELIGEGGFGSVFLAEQEQPIRRKVALKIIKLGMDTRQVVARFEQERQALAMMSHPNIAKVLDAGATESGRPFFVMELVQGEPIVAFCDKHSLSIPERLELFSQVCSAVQHAHTKGVIHRDIKPTNILVTTQGGRPHSHVIDFGIAKATASRLTDKTLFTEHAQLIGTPQYMSPEQAQGSLDIDTRTDVYSLGVLLYELLTGSTPFSGKELRQAAYAEIQRIIREVEPPRPSTRLSQSAGAIATVAASRKTQPAKLGAMVRGELDWVVMKALEKERNRRYESPSSLEADIQRYLKHEAVIAAPPGNVYRLSKFVRRHKGPMAAIAAVVLSLVVGVIAFAWQARVAVRERDAAEIARKETKERAEELQQVSDFQGEMLRQIDATFAGEQLWADLRARLGNAFEGLKVPETDRTLRAKAFSRELAEINATDTAAVMIDRTILTPSIKEIESKFKDQPSVRATLNYSLAMVYRKLGLEARSLPLAINAADTFERIHGKDHENSIQARTLHADLLFNAGQADEAVLIAREAMERGKRVNGIDHSNTLSVMSNLGNYLRAQKKFSEAEPILKETLDGNRRTIGNEARNTLISANSYGYVMIAQGNIKEAERYWREAYETGKRVFGTDDPDVLVWAANMGGLLMEMGSYEESAAKYREAIEGFRRVRGEEHPYTTGCRFALTNVLVRWGGGGGVQADEAASVLKDILDVQQRTIGPEHVNTLGTQARLGHVLMQAGKSAEAEAMAREAVDTSRRVYSVEHEQTLSLTDMLAVILSNLGKYEEANSLFKARLDAIERSGGAFKERLDYLIIATQYADSLYLEGGTEQLTEAEKLLRDVVGARERLAGTDAPTTADVTLTLGLVLRELGKYQEADPLITKAVDVYRSLYAGPHASTAKAIHGLAKLRMNQGRAVDAEPLFVEALDMHLKLFSKDHPAVILNQQSLDACRAAMKR